MDNVTHYAWSALLAGLKFDFECAALMSFIPDSKISRFTCTNTDVLIHSHFYSQSIPVS